MSLPKFLRFTAFAVHYLYSGWRLKARQNLCFGRLASLLVKHFRSVREDKVLNVVGYVSYNLKTKSTGVMSKITHHFCYSNFQVLCKCRYTKFFWCPIWPIFNLVALLIPIWPSNISLSRTMHRDGGSSSRTITQQKNLRAFTPHWTLTRTRTMHHIRYLLPEYKPPPRFCDV